MKDFGMKDRRWTILFCKDICKHCRAYRKYSETWWKENPHAHF